MEVYKEKTIIVAGRDKYQYNMNISIGILQKVREVQEKLNQKEIQRKYADMN